MFKKTPCYLSLTLLLLPLVANAAAPLFAKPGDLRPLLTNLRAHCAPLPASLDEKAEDLLQQFYAQRAGQPAWQSSAQLLQLNEQIEQLADDGLASSAYPLPLVANTQIERYDCADLLTTHSYLQALLHLRRGRLLQQRLEPLWRSPALTTADPQLATLSLALLHVQMPSQAFVSARPASAQYQHLRQVYARQRLQPLVEWPTLDAGALLKPQGEDPRLPTLRQRLSAEGYLTPAAGKPDNHYDADTQAALEQFQRDHGLNPDGILGPASLTELNVSAQVRREQLRANLERLRWLADDVRAAEVLINVAAGELQIWRQEQLLWRSRTQVGRADRQTPLLASRLERLTLNPTWTVPPTILREDKIPAIRNDLGYLERHQISVLDRDGNRLDPQTVDWDNPGAIRLRQAAGSLNPLGRLALRFDNPFAVYLHDTPSQQLFSKAPRAFSSGCVRVEAVDNLLAWLLSPDELGTVRARIADGTTQQYRLRHPAPLLIAYWTAEANNSGGVRYYPDIYARDARLIQALAQHAP
ncbi:murein L,D-transpeptidase [Pseudomonas sp. HMWF032]|uniref:L,D-transpeptidase family protein n=1 Tax=unclassified Pseudomonas TaxID=196821 RepID=UPI000D35078E|nr:MULTISPECIES: L,D-transpeptidase family protein [unclassified Pseudomonas]PTS84997.1 murein L,D-transpeptidase [Pseudomonas sp. HMWF032]PTT83232.1 murein L,D-transpeptidase [Pseudomonas sp. HMWF010]WAC46459.1 L,D-transpeptidase family protein [Pseudomonas sp. SL4(2022)]